MSETEINQDILHIMKEIIKENRFIDCIEDKNIEYEIKSMTFIIFSEIHNITNYKSKKFITNQFKILKKELSLNNTNVKNDGNIIIDTYNININNNGKKEIIIEDIFPFNSKKNNSPISSLNTEKNVELKNDNLGEIIILQKKNKKNTPSEVNRKNAKKSNKKKQKIINYKEFLEKENPKDFDCCNQMIKEWENKAELDKLCYLKEQVKYLANLPQPEQRSEEWYKFRKGMLTASDLYKAIGTEGIRRALIIKKCQNNTGNSSGMGKACKHGIKYEDIAILIYEKMKNVKIFDYGCIQDKEFKIFGASPDGICGEGSGNMVGTMLEIKCPTSRKIIEGEVPNMYWKQIQGQLEVCKLWECDFLECKIIECREEEFIESKEEKGIVIDILYNDTNNTGFIYAPLNLFPNNYQEWLDKELDKIIDNDNITFLKISYWYLKKMNCVKVKRDPYWFYSNKPGIRNFWEEVLYHRENGYEELEKQTKKKNKKKNKIYNYSEINECIIQSDSE